MLGAGGPIPVSTPANLPPINLPQVRGAVATTSEPDVIDVGPARVVQPATVATPALDETMARLRAQEAARVAPGAAAPASAIPPPVAAPAAPIAAVASGAAAAPTTNPYGVAGLVQGADGGWYQPQSVPAGGPPAAAAAAPQPSPAAQEARQQPWYQPLVDHVEQNIQTVKGAIGSVGHGATFGLDEILGPVPAAAAMALTQGIPFSQAYDQAVQEQRAPRTQFEAAHPIVGMAVEVGGGLPATGAMAPLFPAARAGAGLVGKGLNYLQNAVTGAGLGAATGATMTDGDIQQRLQGAKQGAEFGGAFSAAAPAVGAMVGAGARALTPVFNPSATGQQQAGRILNEAAGGTLPPMEPSPIAGMPVNVAQASGNKGMATLVAQINADRGNPGNLAAMDAEQNAQNQGILGQVAKAAPGAGAEGAAGAASTRVVQAIRTEKPEAGAPAPRLGAARLLRTEESRLWNRPSLSDPRIGKSSVQQFVEDKLRTMRRDDPALGLVYDQSPLLRRTMVGLRLLPEKIAANQINKISSDFRRIARTDKDGAVRDLAGKLASAVQDGIWQAPEVAGRAPATQAELEAARTAGVPATPARRGATTIDIGTPPVARPQSAVEYLIDRGGVQDPGGDLKAMGGDTIHHQKGGRLINPRGMRQDAAREMLQQEGFLPQDTGVGPAQSDINQLLEMVRDHIDGRPTYRAGDVAQAMDWEAAQRAAGEEADRVAAARIEVKHAAAMNGLELSPAEFEHAAGMRAADPDMHPEEAVRQAVQGGEEAALQANAQRQAFGSPGVPPGAATSLMPDLQTLREGVKADPQLVADLKEARDFTRREAEVLGHASFDNILRRNGAGNEPGVAGTGLDRFLDLANSVERPGSIANVTKFLDDVRSEWLKLSVADRAGIYNPDTIGPVINDLVEGTRDFIMSKMLARVSGTARDDSGALRVQAAQLSKWVETNRDLLRRTGAFTDPQLDDIDALSRAGKMIQRGAEKGRAEGSPTYPLLTGKTWLDSFMSPVISRAIGIAIGAGLGALGHEGTVGVLFGAESGWLGADMVRSLYNAPRAQTIAWLNRGIRDPAIAADLARQANAGSASKMSDATKRWIMSFGSTEPSAQLARTFGAQPTGAAP